MHAEIEDLEERVSRWIPVTEQMPVDRTVVLAWNGTRVVFGYARDGQWIDTLYRPTHWMPMPEPPT